MTNPRDISALTLPAGYLGSSIIGALLIFCGFNIVASKIASIVLGVCFLLTLWWARRDWLTIITVLLAVGLLIACWFIAHAEALRFVVLFIGVMSALYSVWDIVSSPRSRLLVYSLTLHSATISFSAKSTPPTPTSLPRDTEALQRAGVLSGPSLPSSSWLPPSLQPLPLFLNQPPSKETTRNTSSQRVEIISQNIMNTPHSTISLDSPI